jgi:spermidine/putrescine transport system ATP-binding protein
MTESYPKTIVRIIGVEKSFGRNRVLRDCSLEIFEGEFVTILGPSGCGKTTLLRIIAGFEKSDAGSIELSGQVMGEIPPHKRPVNMVFQRSALFPHLTVYDNIAFGLRLKKYPESQIEQKVEDALELVRLPGFDARDVTTLSGGEMSRVALARAIVNEPRVLLLDEPLAALDLKIRKTMQDELRRIHRELGSTFFYVTHDQEEAMAMSDRIVIMSKGEIMQIGTPFEVYYEPCCLFSGTFVGESNILPGRIANIEADKVNVQIPGMRVWGRQRQSGILDQNVRVLIRPEAITLTEATNGSPRENTARGVVTDATLIGGLVYYQISIDDGPTIKASQRVDDPSRLLQIGQSVLASWKLRDTLVFTEE